MNAEHKRILQDKRDILVENVNFQDLEPFLLDYKLFNEYMWKDIVCMEDLLDALPSRGPKAFHNIIEILQKTGYYREADALENCGEKRFYKMSSRPLGYCIIINNVEFEKENVPSDYDPDRKGSDFDAKSLSVFFHSAGFEVIKPSKTLRNMKAVEMTNYLKEFSKREDLANVDSLIVVIMSHGAQVENVDIVFGTDWDYIKKPDICNMFNNENCELLQNKPKIFIFISCRGKHMDYGVIPRCQQNENPDTGCRSSLKYDALESLPDNVSLDAMGNKVIPTMTDTFIVHSTLPCQPSLRHHEEGSYFCQAFLDVLNIYYQTDDLNSVIARVNEKLLSKISPMYRIIQSAHYEALAYRKTFKFCRS